MHKKAYAKITLYLDAYKDKEGVLKFDNIIAPIDLFDMVYLDINPTMHLETNKAYLPKNKKNTVYRAVMLMKKRYHIKDNFKIRIVKNIPSQAGLGGGSANAAVVIKMIDEMYHLNLSDEELIDIAKEIDEDTPYCLFNKLSRVRGIGEDITPISTNLELYYIMIKPSFGTSTQSFLKKYKNHNRKDKADICEQALLNDNFELLINNTYNVFQKKVTKNHPEMDLIVERLKGLGLQGVNMSGTGTTVFGLSQSKEEVIKIFELLKLDYPFVKYGKLKLEE